MTATAPLLAADLDDYQLRLPGFEGPLDVLLRLVERDRLAITDVSLVAVTAGFLAHLAELRAAPPAVLAEFVAVAGRLLVLKSRALLPRPAAPTAAEDESDLARELIEHRRLRQAAVELARRQHPDRGAYPVGLHVARPDADPPRLSLHHPALLAKALRRRLAVVAAPPAVSALDPAPSIEDLVDRIAARLRRRPIVGFDAIRGECRDRRETIVAFLATLLLVRRRAIDAHQDRLFGHIELRLRDGAALRRPGSEGDDRDLAS